MASTKITVRPVRHRGETWYRVRYWKNGKLTRPLFPSKKKADAKAAQLRGQLTHVERVWDGLSEDDRVKLIRLHEQKPETKSPSSSTVLTEVVSAKSNAGCSEDWTDAITGAWGQFTNGSSSRPINEWTVINVESFLDSKNIASRSTLRSRLSTVFIFAVRRGYRSDNPCDRLEAIKYTRNPPAVFTAKQFTTAVKWLKTNSPECLPWFALSTLCGLRPEEAEKTTKADINSDEGFIRVEAQTTKVRQRRIVYPKAEAMAFVKRVVKRGQMPLDSQVRKRMLAGVVWKSKDGKKRRPGLRHALGFKVWPKDITRHTAASYWLASDGSAAHVSEMLGNSEKVLKSHYKALVTRSEAEKFWKVVAGLAKP